MAHTFTQCHYHVVFSTKQRAKLIGTDIRERLWKYLTGISRNLDLIPVAVGGMDDHIHMLFHLPPDRALSDAIRLLKTNSSRWSIRGKFLQPCEGSALHSQPGDAPPQDDLRRRIPGAFTETPGQVRSSVRF